MDVDVLPLEIFRLTHGSFEYKPHFLIDSPGPRVIIEDSQDNPIQIEGVKTVSQQQFDGFGIGIDGAVEFFQILIQDASAVISVGYWDQGPAPG